MVYLLDYSPFRDLVDALMKGHHIKYHLGSKPSLHAKPEDITKSDCSGFVRYLMYNASGGSIEIGHGGGTWVENDWCEKNHLEVMKYSTAAKNDGILRIAFIHGRGEGKHKKIGHVWLILGGKTIECHGHVGADRRRWDIPVLMNGVNVCYKLAIMIPPEAGRKRGLDGQFYEFHRDRKGQEIGRHITRQWALLRVRRGENVYTPRDSDARSLAKDVQKGKADWEGSHELDFYPHYHPAGNHEKFGHVFYGDINYRLGENRRT